MPIYADLRDFTALSEAAESAVVIAALDAWFTRAVLEDILAADPRTPVGIAVQARAAAVWLFLHETTDTEWVMPHIRRVERWAGLEPDPYPARFRDPYSA